MSEHGKDCNCLSCWKAPSASLDGQPDAALVMSPTDQAFFAEALENPPEPNAALKKAFASPAPSSGQSENECPKCGSKDKQKVGLLCLNSFNTDNTHAWHSAQSEPARDERAEFEEWAASLPKCVGDPGECDGSLVGLEHEPHCPMYGKDFANLSDAFKAGWNARAAFPQGEGAWTHDVQVGPVIFTKVICPQCEEEFSITARQATTPPPSPCGIKFRGYAGNVFTCALPKEHEGDCDDHPTRGYARAFIAANYTRHDYEVGPEDDPRMYYFIPNGGGYPAASEAEIAEAYAAHKTSSLRAELAQIKGELVKAEDQDDNKFDELFLRIENGTHELLDKYGVPKNGKGFPDVYDGLHSRLEAHFQQAESDLLRAREERDEANERLDDKAERLLDVLVERDKLHTEAIEWTHQRVDLVKQVRSLTEQLAQTREERDQQKHQNDCLSTSLEALSERIKVLAQGTMGNDAI